MIIVGITFFSSGLGMLVFQTLNPWAMWGGGYIFGPFLLIIGAGLMIPGIIFVIKDYRKSKS